VAIMFGRGIGTVAGGREVGKPQPNWGVGRSEEKQRGQDQ
jgi:hypothetical protein